MLEPERLEFYGKWAFVVGLVLAGVAGILFEAEEAVFWVLAILGVIVGLLNVTREDTQSFLLAAIALTLSATALNLIPIVGETLSQILEYVAAFVAGAMIVVALKAMFETAR
jgi:zinc transporter ZupT